MRAPDDVGVPAVVVYVVVHIVVCAVVVAAVYAGAVVAIRVAYAVSVCPPLHDESNVSRRNVGYGWTIDN